MGDLYVFCLLKHTLLVLSFINKFSWCVPCLCTLWRVILDFNIVKFEGEHLSDTRVGKFLTGQDAQSTSHQGRGYQCEWSWLFLELYSPM